MRCVGIFRIKYRKRHKQLYPIQADKLTEKEDGGLRLLQSVDGRRARASAWMCSVARSKGTPICTGLRSDLTVEQEFPGPSRSTSGRKAVRCSAKLRKSDVVIAPKLDRLFRSVLDALQVVEDLRKHAIAAIRFRDGQGRRAPDLDLDRRNQPPQGNAQAGRQRCDLAPPRVGGRLSPRHLGVQRPNSGPEPGASPHRKSNRPPSETARTLPISVGGARAAGCFGTSQMGG
jgi:hypothetical protein